MKILFLAPNIPLPGTHGGSTHVTEVVRALRTEHEVLVLARRGSSGVGVEGIGFGVPPGPLRHVLPLAHLSAALRQARRFRPDAIYERFSAFGLGVILGRLLGVPVVSMVLDESASPLTLAGADALITTAPHLVPARFQGKVRRVSWGANIDLFHPGVDASAVRRGLGIRDDEIVVGYTGAFYHWHGLETLVEAARQVARSPGGERVRFLLVGDGEMRARVVESIARSGIAGRFLLTGRVPYTEVPGHVAACDICAAPYNPALHRSSRRRGMYFDPLKVFEYLAAGRATVTLDTPNIRRLLEDGEHALLVRPGDVGELTAALRRAIADPELRRRLGEAGRRIAVEKYSWQAHGRQLSGLFRELIAARRQGADSPGAATPPPSL